MSSRFIMLRLWFKFMYNDPLSILIYVTLPAEHGLPMLFFELQTSGDKSGEPEVFVAGKVFISFGSLFGILFQTIISKLIYFSRIVDLI